VPFEALLTSDQDAGVHAREALDGWLNGAVGAEVGEAVRLATSELVSNAVRHGGTPSGDAMRLLVDVRDELVRVDVEQSTSTEGAAMVEPSGRRAGGGGFGLAIVEAVTARWGITRGRPGRVWFEVARPVA
jgi:anti-sigma regulatory factor (Ser/Thr protein kinase)